MKTQRNDWETNRQKNLKCLALWTGGWLLTMALVVFGPEFLWDNNTLISALSIFISTLVGVGMIVSNWKHIKGLDEMHRKITMEAMAIALGVGVVGGLSLSALEVENVIAFDAEISYMVILIGITYLISMTIGHFKYK
jgi:hypothetical protein